MKKILLLLVFLCGCSFSAPSSITVRVDVEDWSFEGPSSGYSYSVEVEKGDEFGPEASAYTWEEGEFLFEVKKIIDEESVKVAFNEEVVVVYGDDVAFPEIKGPVIVTLEDEVCFKTRTMDSGSDFCLRVE